MGSITAGLKSGLFVGAIYAGLVSAFYLAELYVFNGSVISTISNYQGCATEVNSCFNSIITSVIPYDVLIPLFTMVLIFCGIYGYLFEYLPGKGYAAKALSVALVTLITYLNLFDYYLLLTVQIFDFTLIFMTFMVAVFAYTLGSFYRRYSRKVEVISDNPKGLKILVDGHDSTGKTRTYAYLSSHTIRASQGSNKIFREWLSSGGVVVTDPKSLETKVKISGDGILKARAVG